MRAASRTIRASGCTARRDRPLLRALYACAALASFGTPAHADAAPRPTTAAVESDTPLKIDGALDEAAWRSAPEIASFQLMAPREGQAPDESTSVRVLIDGDRVV